MNDCYTTTEVFTNCTVQVLISDTGETSVGWTQDMSIAEEMIRQANTVNGG